ncbi:hypothetical protein KUTeg_019339 [Tegillarca granosa]|uniref:C2H2-type domain-containing protein n=1 Tax=Tegillarca granosa TaxID=220873 RepID=A0ABQ9EC85_TEGGR|nr:hypothetical protein KUTeg_019339 [Tegillarca granosa]
MATIKVNGCGEDTKEDVGGDGSKDNIVSCNSKVMQNHLDYSKEDSCDKRNAQSSPVNKDDSNLVNHKSKAGCQQDCESVEIKLSDSKNLNGTNEGESINKETLMEDKYSGFGIRPHNADDKDEEETDSPSRMVFSLAGFAPLNVEKEKDSVKINVMETAGDKEDDEETINMKEIKENEVDKNQETIAKDECQELDIKMDCSDSDKVHVKADENKDEEIEKGNNLDKDNSKNHESDDNNKKILQDKCEESVEKSNDDVEYEEKKKNEKVDSNSENCNKEEIEDKETNENIERRATSDDKTESKENNDSEMKEAEIDDSLVDNEGCSDREDKQDVDNDSIVILDGDEGNSVKNKNTDSEKENSTKNKEIEKNDVDGEEKEKKVDVGKSHDQDKDLKADKSVDKVIVDGSEIVITINEDESGDDSGKDADDESDDDDDDNKERKKKLHNKISPTKTPQVLSQDKDKNSSSDDLVVTDNNQSNDGKKPDGSGGTVEKQSVTQKNSKTVVAVPPGFVTTNSTNRPYILPASTSQVSSTGQQGTGGQYFKVMGQKNQTFYMPVSSQYVITNSTAPNQSTVARSGQAVTVTSTTQPATGTKSILTDKIDEDIASSSWEQLELVKYDIAMRKPDNTFWMGLANVNKKAEISSVTKFLFDLGSDIVKESAYRQIINVQNKKLESGKLNKSEIESLDKMKSVVKDLKAKVGFLDLKQMRCKGCGFQTSSKTVMNMHKEYPHMTPPYDMYGVLNCVHCDFNTKIPTNYTYHMSAEHNMTGRVYDKPALHQCNLCQFESNAKPKLTQHRTKCTKSYKPHLNQAPYHFDINYCLKNIFYKFQIKKPPQPKVDSRPKKVLPSKNPIIQPKNVGAVYPGQINPRPQVGGRFVLGPNQNVYRLNVPNQPQYNQQYQQFAISSNNQRPGFNQRPNQSPNMPYNKISPRPQFAGKPTVGELLKQQKAVNNTVAPRPQLQPRPQPAPPQQSNNQANAGGFEVCEMCGGYVKDKMSLRIHFYYAHKIDMPAAVFNRPNAPLACEVCKKRFWTTQGLTKHKQSMKHNFIPSKPVSSPQNQAMCWICHQKPDNLYSHLHKFHKLTTSECMGLKRCMFCGTLCSTRKELEIHMAAAHGVLIKGEGGPTTPNTKPISANTGNVIKPGAGVSVSTRTVVTGTGSKANPALVRNNFCVFCAKQFSDNTALTLHCLRDHATCSGCGMVVAKASDLKTHVCKVNRSRSCEICGIKNLKSVYYTKHVTTHLKKCHIKLKRLSQGEIAAAVKRKRTDNVTDGNNIEIISDSQSDDDSSAGKIQKLEQKTVESKDNTQANDSKDDKNSTDLVKNGEEKKAETITDVKDRSNDEKVEEVNKDVKEEIQGMKNKGNEGKIEEIKKEVKEKIIENEGVKSEVKSDVKEKNAVNTEQNEDIASGNKRKSEDESDEMLDVQTRKRLRSSDKSD